MMTMLTDGQVQMLDHLQRNKAVEYQALFRLMHKRYGDMESFMADVKQLCRTRHIVAVYASDIRSRKEQVYLNIGRRKDAKG